VATAPAIPETTAAPAVPFRAVAEWLWMLYPDAKNVRIVGDVPDGLGGMLPVSLPIPSRVAECQIYDEQPTAEESDAAGKLAEEILAVLGTLKPGQWMSGAAVAAECDTMLDHKGGTFKRAISSLKGFGPNDPNAKIESHPKRGYRLLEET